MATTVQCPYCGDTRRTQHQVKPGSKFRCPTCRNTFAPPWATSPGPRPDEPAFVDQLEVALEELPNPPPFPAPVQAPVQPDTESATQFLGAYRAMTAGYSRKLTAGILGIGALGLGLCFVGWHLSRVRSPGPVPAKAASQHTTRIQQAGQMTPMPPPMPVPPTLEPSAQRQPEPSQPDLQLPPQSTPLSTMAAQLSRRQPSALSGGQISRPQPVPKPAYKSPATEEEQKKATGKVYLAKRLEKEGKVRLANSLYREVMAKYGNTLAAEEARKRVGFSMDKRVEHSAKLLALAQGFESTGSLDEAKANYNEIVTTYPETEQAHTARERLKALDPKK